MDACWAAPRDSTFPDRAPTVEELAGATGDTEPWSAFALQQGAGGHAVVGGSLAASLREDAEHPETARGLARRALRFVPGLAGGRPDPAAARFDPARFTTAAPPRAGTASG